MPNSGRNIWTSLKLSIVSYFANKPSKLTWLFVLLSSVQALIGTDSITNLHKLEQVSSDEGIGTLAENLLEALREHSDVNLKIEAARRETRAEKKRMAMAMRQKALGTLGMTVLLSSFFCLNALHLYLWRSHFALLTPSCVVDFSVRFVCLPFRPMRRVRWWQRPHCWSKWRSWSRSQAWPAVSVERVTSSRYTTHPG